MQVTLWGNLGAALWDTTCALAPIMPSSRYYRTGAEVVDNFHDAEKVAKSGDAYTNIKKVYNSIKYAPNYPKEFKGVKNGTTVNKVKSGWSN